jgi:hypothetical protein
MPENHKVRFLTNTSSDCAEGKVQLEPDDCRRVERPTASDVHERFSTPDISHPGLRLGTSFALKDRDFERYFSLVASHSTTSAPVDPPRYPPHPLCRLFPE